MKSAADLSSLEIKHLVRLSTELEDGVRKSVGNTV